MSNPIDPKALPSVHYGDTKDLPAIGGVYFVWRGEELLYLGKAGNIRRRWEGHHRHAQMLEMGADRITWMDHQDLLTLDGVERELIDQLSPLLNRQQFTPPTVRSEVFNVHLKDHEFEKIKRAADASGLKPSQYLRMAGLKAASRDLKE